MQRICGTRGCYAPLTMGAVSRGLRLCNSCRSLLTARLASLPALYQACEQALAVRSDTTHLLSSWSEMIVDERGVTGPTSLDVTALTSFVQAHLDWLAAHPAAADFADEIEGLAADGGLVLNAVPVRITELGPCTRDGCGRMVRARAVNQSSVPQVRCDAGHAWQPHQWLHLRHRLDPSGRRTAREVYA